MSTIAMICLWQYNYSDHTDAVIFFKLVILYYWTNELIFALRLFESMRVMIQVIWQSVNDINAFLKVIFLMILNFTLLDFILLERED